MTVLRVSAAALLAAALALSACGLKGDPIRPGSEKDLKRQQERQQQQKQDTG
jgi:predicted small lipoprotein YifL